MIEVRGLHKAFGEKKVLNDINLTIPDANVFGLVGINGAGKSTLLRLLSGVYKPDKGDIFIDGERIRDNDRVRRNLFFLSDDPYYTSATTPRDLLILMKTFYKVNEVTYFKSLDQFSIPIDKKMTRFSKGMKRQVFVSMAFAIRPKYMLLDEAFDGLDPLARIQFKKEIRELVEEVGTTVIISSHSLRELEDICDCFALLNKNTIVSSGTLSEAIGVLHKYQFAVKEDIDLHLFPRIFKAISKDGRVIRIVTELEMDEFAEKIKTYNPLFIDELPMDFEEMFTALVQDGGLYL